MCTIRRVWSGYASLCNTHVTSTHVQNAFDTRAFKLPLVGTVHVHVHVPVPVHTVYMYAYVQCIM